MYTPERNAIISQKGCAANHCRSQEHQPLPATHATPPFSSVLLTSQMLAAPKIYRDTYGHAASIMPDGRRSRHGSLDIRSVQLPRSLTLYVLQSFPRVVWRWASVPCAIRQISSPTSSRQVMYILLPGNIVPIVRSAVCYILIPLRVNHRAPGNGQIPSLYLCTR